MADTYGTISVNGQIVPVIGRQAVAPPAALGPMYSGPGQAPLATIPSGGSATVGGTASAGSGGGGLSLRMGLILVGMFALGILGLRYVHWGK